MGMKKHRFVGSVAEYWLPDDITVSIRIVTSPRFRSYTRSKEQIKTTWHDTGNPNTTAEAEYEWAKAGRPGGSVGGYNFILGDKLIIQTAPLDEVTWAAGTNTGNVTSWHTEQSLNVKSFEETLRTGAALQGAICAAQGWDVGSALVQHNVWYGKDCPGQIRHKGRWPEVVKMTKEAAARAVLAAAGKDLGEAVENATQTVPGVYPKPVPIPELAKTDLEKYDTAPAVRTAEGIEFTFVYDVYESKRATPRLRYADIDNESDANRVGPDIPKGTRFVVAWIFTAHDGKKYGITPYDTRVFLDDLKRVDDTVEEGR